MASVGRAEGNLFDGLVHDEAFGFLIHHAKPVTTHVQNRSNSLVGGKDGVRGTLIHDGKVLLYTVKGAVKTASPLHLSCVTTAQV